MKQDPPTQAREESDKGHTGQKPWNGLTLETVQAQMEKVLASREFCHSKRMSRFIHLTVEKTLHGQADQLKEYLIGLEVFDRNHSYDPRTDPIVRVEARRLRSKLREYYEKEGQDDLVAITFPLGSYVPVFQKRNSPTREAVKVLPQIQSRFSRNKSLMGLAVLLLIGLVTYWVYQEGHAGGSSISSIVVLPLRDMSRDGEQAYFADGITESLTAVLAKMGALRVISGHSAMQYKDTHKTLQEIARELKVEAVVEGSVHRYGPQVRINAQLIQATTNRCLWAESYERDLSNISTLHSEVAMAIADEIRIRLTPQERARLSQPRSVNPEAFVAYLKGRYFWNKGSREGLDKAIAYFLQAVEIDRRYALAYTGLADCYALLSTFGAARPKESFSRAKAAAQKALEIEDTLGEAHAAMGLVRLNDWDWRGGERELRRAIELNPNYASARNRYGTYLSSMGRFDEALAEIKRAHELDPLSLGISANFGWQLCWARQFDQAIEHCLKVLEMDPNFVPANSALMLAYEQKSMFQEAIEVFQKLRLLDDNPVNLAKLGRVYALSGKRVEAQKLLDRLQEESKGRYVPSYDVATVYAGLGQKERAFACLQKAYEERYCWLVLLKVDPRFDTLRSDPRYLDLLNKLGVAN